MTLSDQAATGSADRDAVAIALTLTTRQKAALDYIRPHSVIAAYKWPAECQALAELGLVEFADIFTSITPRGLDVRAALLKALENSDD